MVPPPPAFATTSAPEPAQALTFVCCIEHGRLEQQTLLMLSTLRTHGGRFAGCRALAVVGRFGAALAPQTRQALARLGCELVTARGENPRPWFNYANKIVAVGVAQRMATTPLVAWLDSDVLVAGEPAALLLRDDEDFAARSEYLPPAIVAGDATHVPYWQRLCAVLGVRFDALPLIEDDASPRVQRMYFNSGIFVWRRGTAFAASYRRAFEQLLDSRLAQFDGNFFTADQVTLGPVLLRERLRWRHLRCTEHHMTFQGQIDGPGASPSMAHSALIHYSRSLNEPFRGRFLARLARECPWLLPLVDVSAHAVPAVPWHAAATATVLRVLRGLQWRRYAARVQPAPKG